MAPASASRAQTSRLGESRTSSLPGLNARPSAATLTFRREPPGATALASDTTRSRRPRFAWSTALSSVDRGSAPSREATAWNARMSLGRQPPPKPSPGDRKFRPIRASSPIASASSSTSAPDFSHTSATMLMNEILVARNALADTFTSSAVSSPVTISGMPAASWVAYT